MRTWTLPMGLGGSFAPPRVFAAIPAINRRNIIGPSFAKATEDGMEDRRTSEALTAGGTLRVGTTRAPF
jgi:hypothetical protein